MQIEQPQQQSNYKPLQIKKFPQKAFRDTPENKFWKKYENQHSQNMDAIIHSIHSGNNDKNYIAYTDGINVQIYDTQSSKVKQQFTNMKNEITSVALRKDAGLVALGNINGYIQVYDIKRKLQLRSFKNHQKAVHALHFTNQESNLYSGSDDLNIRLFDVAGGNIVRTIGNAHQDFIRSIHTLPNNHNNLLSSSYDFKINLFDFNAEGDKPKMVFDHGHPVEDIAVLPSGFQFISVGGTQTNIWDIRTGKILESLNNNQKTVTCVQYLSTGDRFITGAQDNHVKIYRTDTFTVTHQYKMPSPVVALDFTQDTKHFAVGMSDGQLVIKKNSKKLGDQESDNEGEDQEDKEDYGDLIPEFMKGDGIVKSTERLNSYKFFNRGVYSKQENYDLKYEEGKKQKKLNKYDKMIKKFQYRECLLTAFKANQADIIASLYEEFIQRGCLKHSLTNLDQEEQQIIFEFIEKKIVNPRFSDMCIDLCNILIELYQFESEDVLNNLYQILTGEVQVQKEMKILEGGLETIINTNILQ